MSHAEEIPGYCKSCQWYDLKESFCARSFSEDGSEMTKGLYDFCSDFTAKEWRNDAKKFNQKGG